MIHYMIQLIAFQLVFLLIYDVFLKRETFFNWNRAYLIVSALISVVIPFIKIRVIKTLPKMIPGEHKGKKVTVPYSLPMVFKVQDDKPQDKKE